MGPMVPGQHPNDLKEKKTYKPEDNTPLFQMLLLTIQTLRYEP